MDYIRTHSTLLCARCLTQTVWRYMAHYQCWQCGGQHTIEKPIPTNQRSNHAL